MKTISAALQADLEANTATLCRILKITRKDGNIITMTDATDDVIFNGTLYYAYPGFRFQSLSLGENGEFANVDLEIGVAETAEMGDPIIATDIIAGYYDGAIAEISIIDYADPGAGSVGIGPKFTLGDIVYDDARLSCTIGLRSESASSVEYAPRIITPPCAWQLGDNNCGVPINPQDVQRDTAYGKDAIRRVPDGGGNYNNRHFKCTVSGTTASTAPTYDYVVGNTTVDGTATFIAEESYIRTGVVTEVYSPRSFKATLTAINTTDGFFRYGALRFTSGENIYVARDIRRHLNQWFVVPDQHSFYTWISYPGTIEVGDTFEAYPGCALNTSDCSIKFNNITNYGGFPWVTEKGFIIAIDEVIIEKSEGK